MNPSYPSKSLVVFDIDHTLLTTNISFAFGKYLYQIGALSFPAMVKTVSTYFRHKAFGKSLNWVHYQALNTFLNTFEHSTLKDHVTRFYDLYLLSLFHLPTLHYLEEAKKSGKIIALMSSSPDFLVQPLANRLCIPSWIGTCYGVNEKGRLHSILSVVDGEFKAEYLRRLMTQHQIEQDNTCVLSDSILDLPLFEMAGLKVGVNPDRKLKQHCKKHGWNVVEV